MRVSASLCRHEQPTRNEFTTQRDNDLIFKFFQFIFPLTLLYLFNYFYSYEFVVIDLINFDHLALTTEVHWCIVIATFVVVALRKRWADRTYSFRYDFPYELYTQSPLSDHLLSFTGHWLLYPWAMVPSSSRQDLFLFSLLLLAFGTSVVLHVDWFFVFNKKCKHSIRKSYFYVQSV